MITSITAVWDNDTRQYMMDAQTGAIADGICTLLRADVKLQNLGSAGHNLTFVKRRLRWSLGDIGDSLGLFPDTFDTYSSDGVDPEHDSELEAFAVKYLTFPITGNSPHEIVQAIDIVLYEELSPARVEEFRAIFTRVRS